MKFLNVVGPQIRKLRYDRGWSQSELAVKLQLAGWDISRSGLAKIESKLVWVGDYELFYFMKVFQVGSEVLLPKIDPTKPTHDALLQLLRKNRATNVGAEPVGKNKASVRLLTSSTADASHVQKKLNPHLRSKVPFPYIPPVPSLARHQATRYSG